MSFEYEFDSLSWKTSIQVFFLGLCLKYLTFFCGYSVISLQKIYLITGLLYNDFEASFSFAISLSGSELSFVSFGLRILQPFVLVLCTKTTNTVSTTTVFGLVLVGDYNTVPLTRISCNTVFSKYQNARKEGTLCIMYHLR